MGLETSLGCRAKLLQGFQDDRSVKAQDDDSKHVAEARCIVDMHRHLRTLALAPALS